MDTDNPTFRELTPVSSICTTGHRANVLTGVVLRLLREHFSNPAEFEFSGDFGGNEETTADLRKYVWDNDRTKATILIDPSYLWNTQDIQRRPGIYLKRNETKNQRIALDHGWTQGAPKNEAGKVIEILGEWHSTMLAGSHTIFVTASTGAEVELLGQEVFNHLLEYGPLIRRDLKLIRWDVQEWQGMSKLEESSERFVTPVVVQWACPQTWRLRQEAPWLKAIGIDVQPL